MGQGGKQVLHRIVSLVAALVVVAAVTVVAMLSHALSDTAKQVVLTGGLALLGREVVMLFTLISRPDDPSSPSSLTATVIAKLEQSPSATTTPAVPPARLAPLAQSVRPRVPTLPGTTLVGPAPLVVQSMIQADDPAQSDATTGKLAVTAVVAVPLACLVALALGCAPAVDAARRAYSDAARQQMSAMRDYAAYDGPHELTIALDARLAHSDAAEALRRYRSGDRALVESWYAAARDALDCAAAVLTTDAPTGDQVAQVATAGQSTAAYYRAVSALTRGDPVPRPTAAPTQERP